LAEKLQNPIGNLISVPLQNNSFLNTGPNKGVQNVLNIQPVIPIHLNPEWNVITRTILPLVWSPSGQPFATVPSFGSAPTVFSAVLSPEHPVDGWVWGVGPIAQLPTISSKTLGSNIWGLGPALVLVKHAGPIVAGALLNSVFSLGGNAGPTGSKYSLLTFQPFLNYNFGDGWFVGSVPILTASWLSAGTKWTVPLGLQGGRLVKLGGRLPVNLVVGAYDNVVRAAGAGNVELRTQITFVF